MHQYIKYIHLYRIYYGASIHSYIHIYIRYIHSYIYTFIYVYMPCPYHSILIIWSWLWSLIVLSLYVYSIQWTYICIQQYCMHVCIYCMYVLYRCMYLMYRCMQCMYECIDLCMYIFYIDVQMYVSNVQTHHNIFYISVALLNLKKNFLKKFSFWDFIFFIFRFRIFLREFYFEMKNATLSQNIL